MFSARSDGDYIGSKINSVVICNGVAEAQIDGAFGGKELVYSKSCLAVSFFRFQSKSDVDAPNYQNTIFQFDFTNGFRFQSVVRCRDLTRLQRASKCAGESTGCRRYDVIQRRGVVFECSLRQSVMSGHRTVRSEDHWFLLRR